MFFYYLIRSIHPQNCTNLPTFQVVCCNIDRAKVEAHYRLILKDPKLSALRDVSYSIEKHSDNVSAKSLQREFANMQKSLLNKTKERASQGQTWGDIEDVASDESTNMSVEVMV